MVSPWRCACAMPRAPLFVPTAHEPGKEGQAGEGGLSVCDSGRCWWEGKQAPLARAKQAASEFSHARRMWSSAEFGGYCHVLSVERTAERGKVAVEPARLI